MTDRNLPHEHDHVLDTPDPWGDIPELVAEPATDDDDRRRRRKGASSAEADAPEPNSTLAAEEPEKQTGRRPKAERKVPERPRPERRVRRKNRAPEDAVTTADADEVAAADPWAIPSVDEETVEETLEEIAARLAAEAPGATPSQADTETAEPVEPTVDPWPEPDAYEPPAPVSWTETVPQGDTVGWVDTESLDAEPGDMEPLTRSSTGPTMPPWPDRALDVLPFADHASWPGARTSETDRSDRARALASDGPPAPAATSHDTDLDAYALPPPRASAER